MIPNELHRPGLLALSSFVARSFLCIRLALLQPLRISTPPFPLQNLIYLHVFSYAHLFHVVRFPLKSAGSTMVPRTTVEEPDANFTLPAYETLSEGPFRLLALLLGIRKHQICCETVTAPLKARPIYEAVSYTWSAGCEDGAVPLKGFRILAGDDLIRCLLHLRNETTTRSCG